MAPVQKLHDVHVKDVSFDDPRMNICCQQSPCITTKAEFRNLCLRHDVLEVANILNWSHQFNRAPSFAPSTFRNQAYRNFVLWQHGPMGAGMWVPVPACVHVQSCKRKIPQPKDNTGATIPQIQRILNKKMN
uniref:Uncharacterized protein LOC111109113 n=1 Tax=Crassostrea virginica TaxID=6565 RepID=A0A8B8BDQ4_CRAVI|nr:uncharacterized protein LOC111109113 [Crassostrea virginica]